MSRNPEDPVFNHIEHVRTSMGLSRQQLADRVGVHYQTMSYIERGEYAPTLALTLRLAAALDCKVEQLFKLKFNGKWDNRKYKLTK